MPAVLAGGGAAARLRTRAQPVEACGPASRAWSQPTCPATPSRRSPPRWPSRASSGSGAAPGLLVPALLRPVPMASGRWECSWGPGAVGWPRGRHRAPRSIPTSTPWEVVASPCPSHFASHELAQGRASHPDHDLPSSVTCFQVPHRLAGLTQRVGPVDDRREVAGLDEVFHDLQVLPAPCRKERAQPLAHQR